MLGLLSLDKKAGSRAVRLLKRDLQGSGDWIVENYSLDTLARFTRSRAFPRREFVEILRRLQRSKHKSVVSRTKKLLAEFGG
jgi:hypothetical protein